MITKQIDYCMEIAHILNFNRAEACTNHLEQVELKRGEKP